MQDKRFYAIHFFNSPVRSAPMVGPSVALGAGLLVAIFALSALAMAAGSHESGMALAFAMAMGAPCINDFIQRETDLKAEAAGIFKKATEEKRALNETEKTRVDAIKAEMSTNAADIKREEFKLSLERDKSPAVSVGVNHEAEAPWLNLGEQVKAIFAASRKVKAVIDPRLMRPSMAVTGASEGVGADGGFLIDKPFAAGLMERTYKTAQLAPRCSNDPISGEANGMKYRVIDETSRATGSRSGAIRMYWIGEGDQLTASRPKFRIMSLELKKLTGLFYATGEVMADTATLGSVVNREFPREAAFMLDDAILRGVGAGTPLGIINGGSLISVAKETGQAAATFLSKNIAKMWSRLWVGSRDNAFWFINQDVEPQLDELSIPAGTAALEPRYVTYGSDGLLRIKGRQVIVIEHASTLGTQGDVVLADCSEYQLITKGGIRQDVSIHLRFDYDEEVWRFIVRADGQPKWNSALTPYKGTATVSPFVALDTRA